MAKVLSGSGVPAAQLRFREGPCCWAHTQSPSPSPWPWSRRRSGWGSVWCLQSRGFCPLLWLPVDEGQMGRSVAELRGPSTYFFAKILCDQSCSPVAFKSLIIQPNRVSSSMS